MVDPGGSSCLGGYDVSNSPARRREDRGEAKMERLKIQREQRGVTISSYNSQAF